MSFVESMFSLDGMKAVVTGAARGNGLAIAKGLLRAGAEVLLADRLQDELQNVVVGLSSEGFVAHERSTDLGDVRAVESLVKDVRETFGGLDILVNCAGITLPAKLEDYPLESWDTTINVNLRAPFLLCKGLAPLLCLSRSASVINVTSLNSEVAFPDNPAYVASKGGLRQLTRSLALDLGASGVRVNAIGPGYIRTAMTRGSWNNPDRRAAISGRTMLGRWGKPDDLVGAAVFLASPASSYVTGQTIYVDGGWLARGL